MASSLERRNRVRGVLADRVVHGTGALHGDGGPFGRPHRARDRAVAREPLQPKDSVRRGGGGLDGIVGVVPTRALPEEGSGHPIAVP